MARTSMTAVYTLSTTYTGTPAADAIDMPFQSSDTANGLQVQASDTCILDVRNTDVGAQTFTVKGANGLHGPVKDYGPYSLAASDEASVVIKNAGFCQTDGKFWIDTSNNNVKVRLKRL